jgi:hypothetical protein
MELITLFNDLVNVDQESFRNYTRMDFLIRRIGGDY